MPLTVVPDLPADDSQPATGLASSSLIDEIVRDGARKMLAAALEAEPHACAARALSGRDSGYVWADGGHGNVRLEEHQRCLLVMSGVRVAGRKELIALTDGYRESTESWADLLRDGTRRGRRAPVLAVGDGALGFWAARRAVCPQAGPTPRRLGAPHGARCVVSTDPVPVP